VPTSVAEICYKGALRRGVDIVVMVHLDCQYTPKLILAPTERLGSGLYDVALGSRILGGRSPQGACPSTST
jgi:hypothetical protein